MIKFTDDYLCGIFLIDEQHKILCSIVNRLFEHSQDIEEYYKEILLDLENYTRYHFASEEAFWGENSPLDVEEHVKQHNGFISIVESSMENQEFDKKRFDEFIEFLVQWLEIHIKVEDKKMLRSKSHLVTSDNDER